MTEKRFEMIITGADGSFHYLDKNTGEKITSTLELENKLNALHEENEQLKQLIKKVLETTPIEHSLAIDLKNSIRELYEWLK